MKLIKKITAAVTAMAMAASMMSVGASAETTSNTEYWNVFQAFNQWSVFTDTDAFSYEYPTKTKYRDYVNTFTYALNPNGTSPKVVFWGYTIKTDGTSLSNSFGNYEYTADNNLDNDSSLWRSHVNNPINMSSPLSSDRILIVKHQLQYASVSVTATSRGEVS